MKTRLSLSARVLLSTGAVALASLSAACSSDAGPAPFQATGSSSLAAALEARTGSGIVTLTDDTTGAPYGYLAASDGKPIVSATPSPQELRAFVSSLGPALALDEGVESLPTTAEMRGPGGSTIRLAQVVPGSQVPVLGASVVLGVRENGTFAYLENDTVPGLVGFDVKPTVGLDAIKGIAKARGTAEANVIVDPVLGVLRSAKGPVLIYRVELADTPSLRLDIDAKTGEVINEGASDVHALAHSAAFYYPVNDPRLVPLATLDCNLANGKLVKDTRGGRMELFDGRTHAPIEGTDFGTVVVADVNHQKSPSFSAGMAVDAQYNLALAAEFTWVSLGLRFGRADNRIPVYVHSSRVGLGDAAFSPAADGIFIADGRLAGNGFDYDMYPASTAYDIMAHEYAHGVLHHSGLPTPLAPTKGNALEIARSIELRAIHEGLADVFAASAKSARVPSTPIRPEVFLFGPEARRPGSGTYRNALHPAEADPAFYTSRHVRDAEPVSANDTRLTYFRSGLVSHAWALMAYGSANDISSIGVQSPLGVSGAFYAFAIGSMFVRGQNAKITDLAHATIATQIAPASRTTAACAWVAVGVVSETDARARYGAQCAHFDAAACSSLPDGAYCNAKVPSAAYRCKGHSLTVAPAGCMTGQYCQRTSGSFASPAKLDGRGNVQCGGNRDPM